MIRGLLLLALVVVVLTGAVCLGERSFTPAQVLDVIAELVSGSAAIPVSASPEAGALTAPERTVIREIRLPRAILAALVGAALALSGVLMQGLFRNPLADPGVVGISAGGALGAVLALWLGWGGLLALPAASFLGAAVCTLLAFVIAIRGGRAPIVSLLLAGIAINALATAATSTIMLATEHFLLRDILGWLMGSLDARTWAHVGVVLPFLAAGFALSAFVARDLDTLAAGEEVASSLGVNVGRLRALVVLAAALCAGGAVAVSGVIGFVGIIVPHIVRAIQGPAHGRLAVSSAAGGAVLLLVADTAARMVGGGAIRLGIVTSLLGVPFFLYLMRQSGRRDNYA